MTIAVPARRRVGRWSPSTMPTTATSPAPFQTFYVRNSRVAGTRLDLGAGGHARDVSNLRGRGTMAGAGGEEGIAMQVQDYVAAVVFGAAIGLLARILLPGRQRIGLILTVLIGMGAAVAGTWAANRYGIHSDHFFVVRGHRYDWLVVGVQVGIGIVGVAIAALLARAFSSDNRDRRQVERH
jgi:uncharacterized membrane protein YeaQ/YmgE (transglycosylase-associated protein family)